MTISQSSAGQSGSAQGTLYAASSPETSPATRPLPGLAWAVRRALLGIAIMTVSVAAGACLLYFTIDPEAEARAEGDAARKPVAAALPARPVR